MCAYTAAECPLNAPVPNVIERLLRRLYDTVWGLKVTLTTVSLELVIFYY